MYLRPAEIRTIIKGVVLASGCQGRHGRARIRDWTDSAGCYLEPWLALSRLSSQRL